MPAPCRADWEWKVLDLLPVDLGTAAREGHEAAQQSQDMPTRREDPELPQILPTVPGQAHGHTGCGGLRRATQRGGCPGGHL
ncbi:unnamed protein product [Rangifer tarandus platyrhynchus]|uniref:Uncharacterized protein n=1 Tax=Rangifer tarandus platyrhynchus TaxID=3082113 RepID=A0ABN8Y505_RANTA|nr:unnamed protein product [Rangifer tarandus platyrhynchus]